MKNTAIQVWGVAKETEKAIGIMIRSAYESVNKMCWFPKSRIHEVVIENGMTRIVTEDWILSKFCQQECISMNRIDNMQWRQDITL